MRKHRHGGRESRYSRSKQFVQEENDHRGTLGFEGVPVTFGMRGNSRDVVRDENGHGARSKSSNRPPQDDHVQRWLEQTTHEIDMQLTAGLGSGNENGEIALAALSADMFL
jgi:hypothetical protein